MLFHQWSMDPIRGLGELRRALAEREIYFESSLDLDFLESVKFSGIYLMGTFPSEEFERRKKKELQLFLDRHEHGCAEEIRKMKEVISLYGGNKSS